EKVDLVAITVETFTARRAYEIADEFRKRKIPVILGGFHPTLLPEEALEHADSIFLHDAEWMWPEVLIDLKERKAIKQIYTSRAGIGQFPNFLPRRELFKGRGYLPITLMQFGRGCPFKCNFCAISSFFDRQHYTRSVDEVVREIKTQKNRYVFFVDDNIVANRAQSKELFKALIPLKIKWVSQGCIDMLEDKELMDLLVKSGCLGNVIGFESINPVDLKLMGKASNLRRNLVENNKFDNYESQINELKNYGLQTWAAFTLGHDWDSQESLVKTLDFALKHKFTFAAYNILVPYPKTPLYEKLKEEGRLLYDGKWWLHPEYRFNYAAFKPKLMSADELTEGVFEIRKVWNSNWSVLKRFFDLRTNMRSVERMVIYWIYNSLFQKEVFKKQGMHFGIK
ncbi:MAG: B12-binding domain-containing radical SAM protein, partial [Oligoflexia bacterium]|nr:B12-binding domain-containing radical SAM protein [Oligoflexia bacterium]